MRFEKTFTSISWIPSEAMTGPMRLPMDIGLGHYDPPPPERLEEGTLASLHSDGKFRFANKLTAWIEVNEGRITDSGYDGEALVGATDINLGAKVLSVPAISYPLIRPEPAIGAVGATFAQTAGGRTGAPLPRRIDRPPFVRLTAPTAWTTLSIRIGPDGSHEANVIGASPFPRHWFYDDEGMLVKKSGVIDFAEWTRVHDHDRTPWSNQEREALVAEVESQVERALSKSIMEKGRSRIKRMGEGDYLTKQGEEATDVFLILDGMLDVIVDDEVVAEVGPGSVVGERAVLEGGIRTSSLRARTPICVAGVAAESLPDSALVEVAADHHREDID